MKSILKNAPIIILLLFIISGCKKDDANNNNTSPSEYPYYVIANIGDSTFRSENNIKSECASSGLVFCSLIIKQGSFLDIGSFDFFDTSLDSANASYILAMKGKTYPFNGVLKSFNFSLEIDGTEYRSGYVPIASRTGSVIVQDVVADGVTIDTDINGNPYKCFKVIGTFTSKISNSSATVTKEITNGKFSIRVNEPARF